MAKLENSISIDPGENWQVLYEESMATGVGPHQVYNSDSLVVVFEELRQTYYSLSTECKISLLCNDAYIIEENGEVYRYTFTNEDYENAEPIGE